MTTGLRLNPYVGEFRALVREIRVRYSTTQTEAEARAREFVRECGCQTLVLDRLDGRGPIEMIAQGSVAQ